VTKKQAPDRNPDGTFTPEGAKAAGRAGGMKSTSLKSFTIGMTKRKYCNTGCEVYERCPGMPVAQGMAPDEKGRVPCVLKSAPQALRIQVVRMFFQGKDGLVDQIMTTLYRHSAAVEEIQKGRRKDKLPEDPDLFSQDAKLQMDLFKLLYGEKKAVDLTGSVDVPIGMPTDPDVYRKIGDLLASKMNKKE
jgi:hypothetical protein